MNRDLLKEYADLTRELQDVTRRRNEIGELLERERKNQALATARAEEHGVINALVKIAETEPRQWEVEKWGAYAEELGVPTWRLWELFLNLMLRIRKQFPDHAEEVPRKPNAKNLAQWKKWGKYVKQYKSAL